MNQFIYCIKPTRLEILTGGPTEEEAAIIGEHFAYLERLVAQNVVLMAGRTLNTDERTFGIVVFVARSNQEAVELMQNDPAVSRGIMVAELFPYRVALWSPKGPPSNEN
jgi:uncharacterized protein YciI